MKFIYEQEGTNTLTFGQVQNDQFFVDSDGYLCQKINSDSYSTIANINGVPYASGTTCACNYDAIKRILPKVTKIEF
jgi:hypothetical protein